jgi:mannose-1-phosphate guanylyltransferase
MEILKQVSLNIRGIKMKAVILAGGSGERFWPLSTRETPKQFLTLFGETTLIEQTYDRMRMKLEPEDIIIITSSEHTERTGELITELPRENIIGEPIKRNTAAACAIGALLADRDEFQLVVPADHMINDPDDFWKAFDYGLNILKHRKGLMTFGIKPTRADTGYGYIESGDTVSKHVFRVRSFIEKPDQIKADSLLKEGGYFWNSGMFLWKAGFFLEELRKCSPDILGPMEDIDPRNSEQMEKVYHSLPSRSVDYAVMEISKNVMMVKGSFDWSDVGNWSSIRELDGYSKSDLKNILVDSERIFIKTDSERPIAVIGLKDILIIDTGNGLLICSENEAQKVREVSVRLLKEK